MPAPEDHDDNRGSGLLKVAFWIGAGLAPLAAALMLISSGASALRMAAVLAIIAVVLIGLSVMLRPDAGRVRAELEETLFDEIDLAREDGRKDIASAARATHKSFSDKLHVVQQQVDALRGQLEATRRQLEAATDKP